MEKILAHKQEERERFTSRTSAVYMTGVCFYNFMLYLATESCSLQGFEPQNLVTLFSDLIAQDIYDMIKKYASYLADRTPER